MRDADEWEVQQFADLPLDIFSSYLLNQVFLCLLLVFRTQIKLESLEDAVVLDNPAEDLLQGD